MDSFLFHLHIGVGIEILVHIDDCVFGFLFGAGNHGIPGRDGGKENGTVIFVFSVMGNLQHVGGKIAFQKQLV